MVWVAAAAKWVAKQAAIYIATEVGRKGVDKGVDIAKKRKKKKWKFF